MKFENKTTEKLYYQICKELKVHFVIYKNKDEVITNAELLDFANNIREDRQKEIKLN